MPDQDLRGAYLARLSDGLALPDAERTAATEEIAGHIDEAMADMRDRGLPADVAERRALQHLGPPERLADDLTAARRRGSHVLAAVGTAFRISIVSGLQYLLFTWAVIILTGLALSLGVASIGRLLGTAILQADWTPVTAGILPAVAACAVAFGIGRTILAPVAISARRPVSQIRPVLAVAGVAITAWWSLAVVAAPYHHVGALLMASVPGWFLFGLLRGPSRPPPVLVTPVLVFTLIVFVGLAALVFAGGGAESAVTSSEPQAWDPADWYAEVGPFADVDQPPLEFAEGGAPIVGPGPGPVRVERSWTAPAGFAEAWSDVRLEVWPAPPGMLNGPALDPAATQPMATAPISIDGHKLTGSVEFRPRPDREFYYVATTGIGSDGVRMQLAWPDVDFWRWEGTVVDFVRASIQR